MSKSKKDPSLEGLCVDSGSKTLYFDFPPSETGLKKRKRISVARVNRGKPLKDGPHNRSKARKMRRQNYDRLMAMIGARDYLVHGGKKFSKVENRITLPELIPVVEEASAGHRGERTITDMKGNLGILARFFRERFHGRDPYLDEITSEHIEKYVAVHYCEGKKPSGKDGEESDGLAAITIAKRQQHLKIAFEIARKRNLLFDPPEIEIIPVPRKEPLVFTDEDIVKMLDRLFGNYEDFLSKELRTRYYRKKPCVYLLSPWFYTICGLYTAMRPEELLSQTFGDFDIRTRMITFERSKTRKSGIGFTDLPLLETFIGYLNYWIYLNEIKTVEEFRTVTEAWREERLPLRSEVPDELKESTLFPNRHRVAYRRDSMNKRFQQGLGYYRETYEPLELSIPRPSIKMLRSTGVSFMVRQGADIETIRQFMGHTTLKTTSKYVKSTRDAMMAAKKRLDSQNLVGTILSQTRFGKKKRTTEPVVPIGSYRREK